MRTAAALAAQLGMRTIVQLEARIPGQDALYQSTGNVLPNRLLGAEVIIYPDGEDKASADAALRDRAEQERAKGFCPYVIPWPLGTRHLAHWGTFKPHMNTATKTQI